jgi:hypothetical protein
MENKYKVSVSVYGVMKRQRKPKIHVLNLGYFEYSEGLSMEYISKMKEVAKGSIETNMRQSSAGTLHFDFVQIQGGIMTWMPFSEKNVKVPL